jgi:hypothetical protein
MYQFSRAIYRELAPHVRRDHTFRLDHARQEQVLHACESAVERLATDRYYFARPARTLFADIRPHFPISAQAHVWNVVSHYVDLAESFLDANPTAGYEVTGKPMECRATTRKGTPCQRTPLPRSGYCPSHQHLAETEDEILRAA